VPSGRAAHDSEVPLKSLEFYAAAAQVIPVLLLVVGFQIRGYTRAPFWRWFALAEFIFVIAGEIRALEVLRTQETSWADPWMTQASIFILITTIGASLFPWWYRFDPTNVGVPPRNQNKPRRTGRKRH
jgi:cytochrome bd-type quinol oxidase subunit 2